MSREVRSQIESVVMQDGKKPSRVVLDNLEYIVQSQVREALEGVRDVVDGDKDVAPHIHYYIDEALSDLNECSCKGTYTRMMGGHRKDCPLHGEKRTGVVTEVYTDKPPKLEEDDIEYDDGEKR